MEDKNTEVNLAHSWPMDKKERKKEEEVNLAQMGLRVLSTK